MRRFAVGFLVILLVGGVVGLHSAENVSAHSSQTAAPQLDIFVVTSNADNPDLNPIDGDCISSNGQCTLRAAIEEANRDVEHDIIRFDFDGNSTSILPATPLPRITTKITIDGTNNPNGPASGTCPTDTEQADLSISISGFNAPINSHGFVIGPGGSTSVISGLNIVLWGGNASLGRAGIFIESNSNRNIITCNHIGISNLSVSGSQNHYGIIVQGNENEIGGTRAIDRNVILADEAGILVNRQSDPATGNLLVNNFVGTNHLATASLGSMRNGIDLNGSNNTASANVIGGATINGGSGIQIGRGGNTVTKNKIGVDVTGLNPIPNDNGIRIFCPSLGISCIDSTIGGSAENSNIIAYSVNKGIEVNDASDIIPNIISHNDIHHNGDEGIHITEGTGNTIESNAIYANGSHGILVTGSLVTTRVDILSNDIYDNGGSGIFASPSGTNQTEIVSNQLYGNSDNGITFVGFADLRLNEIYSNDGIGIDKGDDGITPAQAPILASVLSSGVISGSFGAETESATIELFINDACDDQLNGGIPYGEGQSLLSTHAINKVDGQFSFTTTPIPVGKFITILHQRDGNTTEFSNCVPITAATFIVNSTNNSPDANPGDGICAATVGSFCTLVAAIDEVNALGGAGHRIEFALGSGLSSININAPLALTTPTVIDGTTNAGASCSSNFGDIDLNIQLTGLLLDDGENILRLADGSDGSEVRGLAFVGAPTGSDGLRVNSDNNVIACNVFGINLFDGSAFGNGDDGIHVAAGNNNRIGVLSNSADRNVFANSGHAGIQITNGSIGTIVSGNLVGTNLGGDAAMPNLIGIDVTGGSNQTLIGGTQPVQGNYFSGNTNDGILIHTSAAITITENIIGRFDDGTADGSPGGNGRYGIRISNASGVTIGDNGSSDRNIVRHSGSHGVYIIDSSDVIVTGNQLRDSGQNGNGSGITLVRSSDIRLGGFSAAAGNDIYDNVGSGIYMNDTVSDVTVQHNEIGILGFGGIMVGNTFHGIHVDNRVSDVTITENFLRYNARNGVRIDNDSSGIVMLENRIYKNGFIGIDLGEDGITDNDASPDADTGANGKTNFPIVTSADSNAQRIEADLKAKPNTEYVVQFFKNDSCVDELGNPREGFSFSRETTVTTDGAGFAAVVAFGGSSLAEGDGITATATEVNGDGTSEFSPCVAAEDGVPTAVAVSSQQAVGNVRWFVSVWGLMLVLVSVYFFGRKTPSPTNQPFS